MINVLIVDDINITTIRDEMIQKEGCILKDKCKVKAYQFATVLPKTKDAKNFETKDVAIHGIKTDEQYDIAFLDLGFPDEELVVNGMYKPIIDLISALNDIHPYCEIIIVSQEANFRKANLNFSPPFSDTKFIAISKAIGQIDIKEVNKVVSVCLDRRLQHLLVDCTHNQLDIVNNYLLNKNEKLELGIGERSYIATHDNLFLQYKNDKGEIEKDALFEKLLELIYDVPKLDDKIWLTSEEKSIYRRYPLKEYYYQYYRYFYDIEKYNLETIISNADYCTKAIINFIHKESNDTRNDVCEAFKNIPETIYRSLKFTTEKRNNKIPDLEMKRFTDFLTNRLLLLGLYYGANLSGTGLNYFLDKNSHANEATYKFFITYLFFSIPEQLSTESDIKIEKIKCFNATNIGFKLGDEERQNKLNRKMLKKLSPIEREYDIIYRSLANYEKTFIKNICTYAKNNKLPTEAMEHVTYILNNLSNWA